MSESAEELLDKVVPLLAQLEEELQVENPEIENYIMQVNQNLREFPELVHLLSDEQIAPLYHAIMSKANVVKEVKKSRSRKGSKGLLSDGTSPGDLI